MSSRSAFRHDVRGEIKRKDFRLARQAGWHRGIAWWCGGGSSKQSDAERHRGVWFVQKFFGLKKKNVAENKFENINIYFRKI